MRAAIVVATAFLTLGSPSAEAAFRLVAETRPFTLLYSANLDGFSATRPTGPFSPSSSETLSDAWSILPSVRVGLGFDRDEAMSDFTIGVGRLWNRAFDATQCSFEGAVRFPLLGPWLVGAHLGLVAFSQPSWHGEADLHISPTTGLVSGLSLQTVGPASLTLSLEYLRATFDVTGRREWTPDRSSIDISGPTVSLGFTLRL